MYSPLLERWRVLQVKLVSYPSGVHSYAQKSKEKKVFMKITILYEKTIGRNPIGDYEQNKKRIETNEKYRKNENQLKPIEKSNNSKSN